jgi:hypothetical protein
VILNVIDEEAVAAAVHIPTEPPKPKYMSFPDPAVIERDMSIPPSETEATTSTDVSVPRAPSIPSPSAPLDVMRLIPVIAGGVFAAFAAFAVGTFAMRKNVDEGKKTQESTPFYAAAENVQLQTPTDDAKVSVSIPDDTAPPSDSSGTSAENAN